MYTEFDYNDEKSILEYKFNKFFGEFSAEARKRLMAKNVIKPVSLYDVFYPSVKDELLTKNVKILNTELSEFSQSIRDAQLAKTIEKVFSLEEQSEDYRKSLLARQNLQKNIIKLIDSTLEKRKDLLSKNKSKDSDLLINANPYRKKNISSNKKDVSEELAKSKLQDYYRKENLSKLTNKESNLEEISSIYRSDDLSNNSIAVSNLDKDSIVYRNKDISYNVPKNTDIESDSNDFRQNNLSNNSVFKTESFENSKVFREKNLSNNILKEIDLAEDSERFRKDDLSNNISKKTDLAEDSERFRKDDLSNNISKKTDLADDSERFREGDLSNNISKKGNLVEDSERFRESDLSNNISKKSDLIEDSKIFRESDLSNNILKKGDLIEDSENFRKNDLSNNISKENNLETDSVPYRDGDLSNNVLVNTDLETDSEIFRIGDLTYNIPISTDLETDSTPYRDGDLSNNTPINVDLEADSEIFRIGDLAYNISINTDLETDSVPYRDGDLSNNTPINTDLETDSVPYRDGDLSNNTPINTDLETDSVPYRDGDLSNNILINTDLETDSVPYRDGDLSNNTSINTDLETDSVPYRDGDLSNNTSINTDLETDSVPYRDGDLSYNIPIEVNLFDDSAVYRENDLVNNTNTTYTIDRHIDIYGNLSTATVEKNYLLKSNIKSQTSLDGFYDQFGNKNSSSAARENNMAKNQGGGMLGFNVMAFGQSQFIGVSGVWAQGLLFRNLLLLRNKKGGFFYSGEDTNIDKFIDITTGIASTVTDVRNKNINSKFRRLGHSYSPQVDYRNMMSVAYGDRLYATSLADTDITKSGIGDNLPINQVNNSGLYTPTTGDDNGFGKIFYGSRYISSPIKKNLSMFNGGILLGIETQKYFGVDFSKTEKINYRVINKRYKSENNTKDGEIVPSVVNVNSLMRQYLKSLNFYSLNKNTGLLNKGQADPVKYKTIAQKFRDFQLTTNPGANTIADLISFYKLFQNSKFSTSVVSPSGENYVNGDVEKMFDNNYGDTNDKSIAFKKFLGNLTDDNGFSVDKTKGVKNIIKRIAADESIEFSQNYKNIQGPIVRQQGENAQPIIYTVGSESGKKKIRQKFTLRNPYAPQGAGKLIFYLKNYAIPSAQGNLMYFPPYIKSFQNSDSTSWNSTNFLGRPEPVYTYNNSSRDGSVTFFVLTDYAEEVMLGRYQTGNMKKMMASIDKNFVKGNDGITSAVIQELDAKISDKNKAINDLTKKIEENKDQTKNNVKTVPKDSAENKENEEKDKNGLQDGDNTNDEQKTEIDKLYSEKQKLEKAKAAAEAKIALRNYSEANANGVNVYNIETNTFKYANGETIFGVGETLTRVESMIKNLSFQPAYFSGSLTDFKDRMEFLSKLTRPTGNNDLPKKDARGGAKGGSGFSFTNPPICHIRLGDWYDHDIVINSVSFDYSDAPWTVGASKIQPMWAAVSIQFNIVGPAGTEGGTPLTASDKDGYYGRGSF